MSADPSLPSSASSRHRASAHPRHRCLGGQCLGGRRAVSGAAVLRLGRRGAAGGHADGQPDRQEPGCHPGRSVGAGPHPRHVHDRGSRSTRCRSSGVTSSSRAPASTRVRWRRRTGFRISPRRIQAWREVKELPDRELMPNGRWGSDAAAGRAAWPGPRGSTVGMPPSTYRRHQLLRCTVSKIAPSAMSAMPATRSADSCHLPRRAPSRTPTCVTTKA
jgi:hypothetical protein